jgi:hypothetical protein
MSSPYLPPNGTQLQRILETQFSTPAENFHTQLYPNGNAVIQLYDSNTGETELNRAFKITYNHDNNRLTLTDLREQDDIEQTNVTFPGQYLLNGLKQAVSAADIKDFRINQDRANLNLKDEEGNIRSIHMGKLKTLQQGQTWYNQHGFFGITHAADTSKNEEIRSHKLSKYIKKPLATDYQDEFGPLQDITVAQFGDLTREHLQKGRPISKDKLALLQEIINQKLPFQNAEGELKYFS